jgi:superfamily II RNA helicase
MESAPLYACLPPADDSTPDQILNGFLAYVEQAGFSLYPHQEEAVLALMDGNNVILHTPTGSGKSLVATALHFKGLAEDRRSFYTSPIKALVNEKFFALCRELGPENVGMMTGDASVNRDAKIICCTAEILANIALREGEDADVDYVIMDEFHYFSDRDRGTAWQVPLLTLPQARFLLMSATLGDVSAFERAIQERTGKPVVTVKSVERPVPLNFEYQEASLHEAVTSAVNTGRAPVYVVSFSQRSTAEIAQALLSLDFSSKDEKRRIAETLAGENFRSPNGKDVQKLLRHGIGIHHAGLLPRYRRLVERLAQAGLLKIVCGTDTLGVGINVPIRTVLLTKLCKYDGDKVKLLSVRDFHQIAGRAGRKGFDKEGFVVALAPEHVVDNLKIEAKERAGKAKKLVRKKPPDFGYVHWDKSVFERMVRSEPEPLVSRFQLSHGMLLNVLGRPSGGCSAFKRLIRDSFESQGQKRRHGKFAISLLRSLWQAGVVDFRPASEGGGVRVNAELQEDFSLFHALGLFLVDAVERIDPESPSYALDVLTLVESILEQPEPVLRAQVDRLKTQKLAELKAAGVEYDDRMAELEKITHPQPNVEFLRTSFDAFAEGHPWVSRDDLRPKSVAREIMENFHTFSSYVKEYGLARSEGLLLRYLSDAYKTLVQTVPELSRTPELDDLIANLGALVRGVDSSLIDEWERLNDPSYVPSAATDHDDGEEARTRHRRLTALVRNLLHAFLRALARRDYESALELVEADEAFGPVELERAIRPLFEEGGSIEIGADARNPRYTQISEQEDRWDVMQNILIEGEVSEFVIEGTLDVPRSHAEKRAVFRLVRVGR